MRSTCVVGLQWGDEAKGKVVDLLTGEHDVVVRFNGGPNAGHTVVVGERRYKLSLVPSGIVADGTECVMGNGLVIDPGRLLAEIDGLVGQGLVIDGRLFISDRAHVIMPWHTEEERLIEESLGDRAIGTTRRGIGPCYADKAARHSSIRVGEFIDADKLRDRLQVVTPLKNRTLRALGADARQFTVDELMGASEVHANRLRPFVRDTFWHLQHALASGRRILFEAAQGTLLDIDHGSFPYVTSSNSSVCGLPSGCGIPVRRIDRIIGIVKAYTTRVGGGPFPTELDDDTGERIRQVGREFGTVTGRARRCGWLDLVAVRYTALLNGVDRLGIMLLDVLSEFDELKICDAYEIDGVRTTEFPVPLDRLARARPIYRTLPGWKVPIDGCRRPDDLPAQAREYVRFIERFVGVPVGLVSVGPARDQTVRFDL
jgi:adenylosuccinate synthase